MQQDHLLKRICGKSTETYQTAQSFLRKAQAKTGPGSGHEVGAHSTGLPSVCAYLASQELRNNEISEIAAQTASCLKPRDFAKTLAIVRSVLFESESHPVKRKAERSPSKLTPSIPNQNPLLRKICSQPETYKAAQALLRKAQLNIDPEDRLRSNGFLAACAYLASQSLGNDDVSEEAARTFSCLTPREFKDTLKLVRSSLVTDHESPTKRRRVAATPSKPGPSRTRASPPSHHSPQPAAVDAMPVWEDDSGVVMDVGIPSPSSDDDELYPRRFRPVFLDHKQWYQCDPRLEQEWKRVELHRESIRVKQASG